MFERETSAGFAKKNRVNHQELSTRCLLANLSKAPMCSLAAPAAWNTASCNIQQSVQGQTKNDVSTFDDRGLGHE